MPTRESLRNAASTLAHYWCQPAPDDVMNRLGVERLLFAYPGEHRLLLCALVLKIIEQRHTRADAESFEAMLYDAATIGATS